MLSNPCGERSKYSCCCCSLGLFLFCRASLVKLFCLGGDCLGPDTHMCVCPSFLMDADSGFFQRPPRPLPPSPPPSSPQPPQAPVVKTQMVSELLHVSWQKCAQDLVLLGVGLSSGNTPPFQWISPHGPSACCRAVVVCSLQYSLPLYIMNMFSVYSWVCGKGRPTIHDVILFGCTRHGERRLGAKGNLVIQESLDCVIRSSHQVCCRTRQGDGKGFLWVNFFLVAVQKLQWYTFFGN